MRSAQKNKPSISILFLVPAPRGISPGQRFRFEHYLSQLDSLGITYCLSNFYSLTGWKIIFSSTSSLGKALYIMKGLVRRLFDLFRSLNYEYIYIYREASPVGPPVFEWILAKLFRKKIIFDFDDAIWIPVVSEYNRKAAYLKSFGKVGKICRWANKVSVGNQYLADYAKQFNQHVELIPTVVNTEQVHNQLQSQSGDKINIGWTGTFSTLPYLQIVLPVLQRLQETFDFDFIIIADKDPQLPLKNYRFIPWSAETEVRDLLLFHIGVMPLYDDDISKGKCGFKAIQYMSLGIVPVVSPVGVNLQIVKNGENGYLCATEKDWEDSLALLLTDPELRARIGRSAQKNIIEGYSVISSRSKFINLFS